MRPLLDAVSYWTLQMGIGTGIGMDVRIKTQEPVFFLHVSHDVEDRIAPFRAVDLCELLQEDLDFLAIGRALREEVQTLAVLDDLRCRVLEKTRLRRHDGFWYYRQVSSKRTQS